MSFFNMNKEHTVKVETLVSLGAFLRHWIFSWEITDATSYKYYAYLNDRFMKHTLFPYFFSLLYAWRGEKQIVSSYSLFYHLPILFLYTFFHSKPSSLVSYMEMRIQCQVNLIIMFTLLSSKGKKWMNSYFLFLKITCWKAKWHNALSGYYRKHTQQYT